MWKKLSESQKQKYKLLISNFASLSEAFSQKSDQVNEKKGKYSVAPIVNSKFQETAFQKVFNAVSEDIANTSYDASLILDENNKFLIGIKSFGIHAGDQKIAQFKSNSPDWLATIQEIQKNAENCSRKEDADQLNYFLYKKLAIEISKIRNKRIKSSKAQIKGFHSQNVEIQAIYHVLMTSRKDEKPQIFVGETSYLPIDIDQIVIEGSTGLNNPTNFKFTDGNHRYKYTSSDSQLLMDFDNKNIILEEWDIEYINDPFSIFENLRDYVGKEHTILESFSWKIELEEASGFNAFNAGSKLRKNERKPAIEKFKKEYDKYQNDKNFLKIISYLESYLLEKINNSKVELKKKRDLREILLNFAKNNISDDELYEALEKLVGRSATEVYIPIPNSRQFHSNSPHFFGENIGTFQDRSKKLKLPKENRTFNLEFLPSGNVIKAYINQDNGKAIQSKDCQGILGEWLLYEVFQLEHRELLTYKKLEELGINGIRLIKFSDINRGIGLEFIWIDPDNPPSDFINY
ncbi:hypothetical protein HIR72_08565 [Pasteurella multocida]|uniref:hypothetical protein n=1 Tax=Pasteurella multocida TaxID=747 RepID=UPI0014612FA7|nr:hypothetical protein [Pasteurella multocida]NMR60718.1 hypothetical protein [Pasteurella multocida]